MAIERSSKVKHHIIVVTSIALAASLVVPSARANGKRHIQADRIVHDQGAVRRDDKLQRPAIHGEMANPLAPPLTGMLSTLGSRAD